MAWCRGDIVFWICKSSRPATGRAVAHALITAWVRFWSPNLKRGRPGFMDMASEEETLNHILQKDQWQKFQLSNYHLVGDLTVLSNAPAHGQTTADVEQLGSLSSRGADCVRESSYWLMTHAGYQCTAENSTKGVSSRESVEDMRQMMSKRTILFHPLFEELLKAHVACLCAATPADHPQALDAQIANIYDLAARCRLLGCHVPPIGVNKQELDCFMVGYISLLQSFKKQLDEHVHAHVREAKAACREIERAFVSVTGMSPTEETYDCDENIDGREFGPLFPTETEMSLMERVRKELKFELKQNYRTKLFDVREEIMRKRRVGQLPGETSSVLRKWWDAHSNWPYPTDADKALMVQETGLELQQLNNWFINQRKRNWKRPCTINGGSKRNMANTG